MCFDAGRDGNTICSHPDHMLYSYCLCHGELPVDSRKVLLVLLRHLFHIPLLHLLWHDDRVHHTEPPSGSYLCGSFLCTLQPVLWFLHSQTGKSSLTDPHQHHHHYHHRQQHHHHHHQTQAAAAVSLAVPTSFFLAQVETQGGALYSQLSVMPLKSDGSLCIMETLTRSQQGEGMLLFFHLFLSVSFK
ncbi:uncharacterized protein LOC131237696 [Magnolia sinica]|uniref:uncharacterized protein LOC131237696 n=1 Tax=Magnolia sinica TaxID=86752 RepID=UPI002658D9C9|nr:uncharacterized protein LOC131237696 [Magnolia sinica]